MSEFDRLYEKCKDVKISSDFITFKFTQADSLQLSYKILLNTIYGMSGYSYSPFYHPVLAGGVTTLGKKNIKKVNRYLESKGCMIIYNDTDSAYFSPPPHIFNEIDKQYYSGKLGKLKYSVQLVKLTQKFAALINPKINAYFRETSPSKFLQLNYEEVLWCVLWVAKKKYAGYKHENLIDFEGDVSFIRGLEINRRESSPFLKQIYNEILGKMLSLDNTYDLLNLCKKVLYESYIRPWVKEDFIKSMVYRPDKQNIQARTFNTRMKARDEENVLVGIIEKKLAPTPNERFNYVIVKKLQLYDHKGRKMELRVGDRMEYLDYAIKHNLEIDMNYYVETKLVGVLARLATYHIQFYVPPIDDTLDEYKASELKIFSKAKKYMKSLCSEVKTINTDRQEEILSSYKYVERNFNSEIAKRVGSIPVLFTKDYNPNKIIKNKKLDKLNNEEMKKREYFREIIEKNRRLIVKQAIINANVYVIKFIKHVTRGRHRTSLFDLKKQYIDIQQNEIMLWNIRRNWARKVLSDITKSTICFHSQRDDYYKEYIDDLDFSKPLQYDELTSSDSSLPTQMDESDTSIKQIMYDNNEMFHNVSIMIIQLLALYEKLIRSDFILDKILFTIKEQQGFIDRPSAVSTKITIDKYVQYLK